MVHGSESEFTQKNTLDYPLLLECDTHGQVTWMSDRTRSALGAAGNLVDTLGSASATASILRFWRVFQTGNNVLLIAQPSTLVESRELDALQGHFQRNCFRLQLAERHLSTRAQSLRPGGSGKAVLQIERERQHLGRELHTGVGQLLAATRLQLEVIAAHLPEPPEAVQQALGRISTLAADALDQVRSISKRLHPPEWQRLTLEAALQQSWDLSGIPQKFEATLRIEPLPHAPSLEVKILLYRGAQEALSNVIRHSRATRVDMSLVERAGRIVLTIRDDGAGFDLAALLNAPASVASGIGLRTISEQAADLGGKMDMESGPGGTTLEISAPFGTMEE